MIDRNKARQARLIRVEIKAMQARRAAELDSGWRLFIDGAPITWCITDNEREGWIEARNTILTDE